LDAGDVIFRLDGRLIRLTSVEANEIHGRLVKLSEGREKLRSQLTQALRHDSQERAVVVDDEAMRQELLRCLWAIEQEAGRMTPGLRELHEAASTPIT
jgi:hypothetical protein